MLQVENLLVDYLSRLGNGEFSNPLVTVLLMKHCILSLILPWYAYIVNYLVSKIFPKDLSKAQKEKIRG